jgi:hypothetical protein
MAFVPFPAVLSRRHLPFFPTDCHLGACAQFPSLASVTICVLSVLKTVSCRSFTAEACVRSQASLCGIYGGQSSTGAGFSPSISVFPGRYHFSSASYSLVYHRRYVIPAIVNFFLSSPCGHFTYRQVYHYKNCTFCPQSAFVCSVWVAEETAIISLYIYIYFIYI